MKLKISSFLLLLLTLFFTPNNFISAEDDVVWGVKKNDSFSWTIKTFTNTTYEPYPFKQADIIIMKINEDLPTNYNEDGDIVIPVQDVIDTFSFYINGEGYDHILALLLFFFPRTIERKVDGELVNSFEYLDGSSSNYTEEVERDDVVYKRVTHVSAFNHPEYFESHTIKTITHANWNYSYVQVRLFDKTTGICKDYTLQEDNNYLGAINSFTLHIELLPKKTSFSLFSIIFLALIPIAYGLHRRKKFPTFHTK